MTEPGPEPVLAAPSCYRHPGRETYIRCGRCDRPICPDCMISAAVGFQCPECVAAGTAGREPRTVFGGKVEQAPGRVSLVIIGTCVAAFVAQSTVTGFTARFALLPIAVADGQWWRLVTAGFLHGGFFHLALNMVALWVVGPSLEAALGRARFVALYGTALLAGSTASYLFNEPAVYSLGASGAIFGLFGATIVILRRLRRDVGAFVGIVLVNLLLPLFFPNIDWRAHVGGLVAGVVVTAVFVYAPRERRAAASVAVVGAVLVCCVLLVGWRTAAIREAPLAGPATDALGCPHWGQPVWTELQGCVSAGQRQRVASANPTPNSANPTIRL